MFAGVWSDDPEQQLLSATLIKEVLSQKDLPGPTAAVIVKQAGLITRLVEFLWKEDFPTLQYEAAWILTNLAADNADLVVSNNAVPKLAQLLASPKDYIREQAIWALGNVAGESRYRDLVLECRVLQPLLTLLLYPDTKLSTRRIGAWTLLNLICGTPRLTFSEAIWALGNVAGDSRYRDLVLECRVLQPLLTLLLYPDTKLSTRRIGAWTLLNLIRGTPRLTFNEAMMKPTIELLLHSNDEDILKYVCLALWHLTEGSEDGIQSVIDAGFVPKLVEILQHPSPDVLSPALRTIGTIASGDNQQTQSVIKCGALPILANLLTRNFENNMIKKVACWTISNITAGTQEQIESVIDAKLIPTLVNLAENAEFGMAKEAAWAISNVTKRASHEQIKYMVEQSCIKPLCDILLCKDIRTILKCLDGLENILKAGEAEKNEGDVNYYCEVIDDVEGLDKIVNLQDHDSNEIYEKALKILETNWEEDDDEETQEPPIIDQPQSNDLIQ